jgi:hypothetical protein
LNKFLLAGNLFASSTAFQQNRLVASTLTPVLPAAFKEVIPLPTDTICQAMVKSLIRFPILLWRYYQYAWTEEGFLTEAYKTELCAVLRDCPEDSKVEET